MPMIRIEFDNEKIKDAEVLALSDAVQKIVSEATGIQDVFVYANSAQIKVKTAPVEVFIQMTASKIKDTSELVETIKLKLVKWKEKESEGFNHPINLTLIPMEWRVEVGI